MRSIGGRPRTRRATYAAIGGLVLTAFAAVLSSYQVTGYIPWMNSVRDWIYLGTVSQWHLSPGLHPLEVVAYLGIAIASVGPFWYLTLRPVLATIGVIESLSPESNEGSTEFDFDGATATRDRPEQDESTSSDRSREDRNSPESDTQREWVEELFSSNQGTEPRAAGAFLGSASVQDQSAVTAPCQEKGEDISASSTGGANPTVSDEVGSGTADRPAVIDGGTTTVDQPTNEGPESRFSTSDSTTGREKADAEPVDPTERIATEVSAAAEKIDRISANLEEAVVSPGIDRSAEEISSMTQPTAWNIENLQGIQSRNGRSVAEAISSLYEDQERVVSALETELQS